MVIIVFIDWLVDFVCKELDVIDVFLLLICILEGGIECVGLEILCKKCLLVENFGKILNLGFVFWLLFGV